MWQCYSESIEHMCVVGTLLGGLCLRATLMRSLVLSLWHWGRHMCRSCGGTRWWVMSPSSSVSSPSCWKRYTRWCRQGNIPHLQEIERDARAGLLYACQGTGSRQVHQLGVRAGEQRHQGPLPCLYDVSLALFVTARTQVQYRPDEVGSELEVKPPRSPTLSSYLVPFYNSCHYKVYVHRSYVRVQDLCCHPSLFFVIWAW